MTNQAEYYDIHTVALGSVFDIRIVPTRGKGSDLLAFRAALLVGDKAEPEKRYVDVTVVGGEARNRILRIQELIQERNDPWVMAQMKLGDIRWETFTYKTGDKKGQTGVAVKMRLLQLPKAWIDREPVVFDSDVDGQVSPADAASEHPTESHEPEEPKSVRQTPLPRVVRLTKTDPKFEQRKMALKANGYKYNQADQSWTLPA